MEKQSELNRYSVITEKNAREIVMLRGNGCAWKRCRFCDYHLDSSPDQKANYELNRHVLKKVTGKYHKLEIINSGSFIDLDEQTVLLIEKICKDRLISTVYFECHWMHRENISAFKNHFHEMDISVKIKTGIETFDFLFRECYLNKGIDTDQPEEIARYFDEACLLLGLPGQTKQSMEDDITTGLKYFERICINIMTENSCSIKPAPKVIDVFINELYPIYKDHPRTDILLNNTDFGVGGKDNE